MKDFRPMAWVLPQPVLIIGTYDADGTPNAMNAAWGGQWDYNEIMISMGSHATEDTLVGADYVWLVSGRKNHDKIARTGWETRKAEHVDAPLFSCFPMTMECRSKEKIGESASGYNLVAEIVNIVCDEKYLAADGKPDVEKMKLITFDPVHNGYIALGSRVGNAFADGEAMK